MIILNYGLIFGGLVKYYGDCSNVNIWNLMKIIGNYRKKPIFILEFLY